MERNNNKLDVQENDQEMTEHNDDKPIGMSQSEEQGVKEVMAEQGNEKSKQQKTYHISSFPEDDEILVKKGKMEHYNEEEKKLLMRVVKEIRYDPERIQPNLRYIDRKKVSAATMKINEI